MLNDVDLPYLGHWWVIFMTSQIGNYINIQEIDHVYRMGIVADRYCKR